MPNIANREGNIAFAKRIQPDMRWLFGQLSGLRMVYGDEEGSGPPESRLYHDVRQAIITRESPEGSPVLHDVRKGTVSALFAIVPQVECRVRLSDDGPQALGKAPPIEAPAGVRSRDFVNALSIAAVANWLPLKGRVEGEPIRVHQLADPELIIQELNQNS